MILVGFIAFAWQAAKRMAIKEELDKFQHKKNELMLHRNYSRLVIIFGIALILIAIVL